MIAGRRRAPCRGLDDDGAVAGTDAVAVADSGDLAKELARRVRS